MNMLFVLVCTASAAYHRHLRDTHAHLRDAQAKAVHRVVPRLQSEDVFHDDFVHDDTAHPEYAVKVNIKESENRLGEAEKEMEALRAKYETVNKAKVDALAAHDAHQEDVETAEKMVAKYTKLIASTEEDKAELAKAKEAYTKTEETVNTTDQAATAAAETVKQAQSDLHERIMKLVDSKDNRSDAAGVVKTWEGRVAEATKANTTLAEWTAKLNTTAAHHRTLEVKVNQTKAAYDAVHGDWKDAEARFDEAEKIFDIDREQYEEYIGPYPPPAEKTENLWWDALSGGKWHDDWPHFF